MSSAQDRVAAVEKRDFRDQRRELEEEEFWFDVDDWNARVDACVVPDCPQSVKVESRPQ